MKYVYIKKSFISLLIIIFISCVMLQWTFGKREDWPFSYFGMYKGRMHADHVKRVEIFFIENENAINLFSIGPINYYYITEAMEKILVGRLTNPMNDPISPEHNVVLDAEAKKKVQNLFIKDLIPYINKYSNNRKIDAVYIYLKEWKNFTPSKRKNPDNSYLILTAIKDPVSAKFKFE